MAIKSYQILDSAAVMLAQRSFFCLFSWSDAHFSIKVYQMVRSS